MGRKLPAADADADQHRRRNHGANRGNRADGDVERAGDDDHRLADRQQPDDHDRLGQAVHDVLPGKELVAAAHAKPAAHDGDQKNKHDQRKDQRKIVGADKADQSAGKFRCAVLA